MTGECYLAFTAKISIVYFLAAASNGNAPDDNIVKETSDRSFMDNPRLRFGLESMLQESMYHKPPVFQQWIISSNNGTNEIK